MFVISQCVCPRQAFPAYSNKHPSLVWKFVNYGRKKIYNICPRSHSFHKLIPELVSSGFRVIVPDFVGFGRSDKLTDWRSVLEYFFSTSLPLPGIGETFCPIEISMAKQLEVKGISETKSKQQSPLWETHVAWFKSNLLLNIQMYNMSSLHKFY